MIRMVEMSVRLGIKSHERKWAQKKGAPAARPFRPRARHPRARLVFRPDFAAAKPPKSSINRQFLFPPTLPAAASARQAAPASTRHLGTFARGCEDFVSDRKTMWKQ